MFLSSILYCLSSRKQQELSVSQYYHFALSKYWRWGGWPIEHLSHHFGGKGVQEELPAQLFALGWFGLPKLARAQCYAYLLPYPSEDRKVISVCIWRQIHKRAKAVWSIFTRTFILFFRTRSNWKELFLKAPLVTVAHRH